MSLIHKPSFTIGYDKAIEEINKHTGTEGFGLMTAELAFKQVDATTSHIANTYVEKDYIVFIDTFNRKWKLQPTGEHDNPIIIELMEREVVS